MDKDKRKKLIWLIIIIIVIVVLLLLILRGSEEPTPEVSLDNTAPPVFTAPSKNFEFVPPEVPPQTDTEFTVTSLAKSFAERFGSWSTDNQGVNLTELLPLSTSRMQNYLNSIEVNYEVEEFAGLSTKGLSADILSLTADSAKVMVGTQRIETKDDLSEDVFYQDIEMHLVKVGDEWLVDGAFWQ